MMPAGAVMAEKSMVVVAKVQMLVQTKLIICDFDGFKVKICSLK